MGTPQYSGDLSCRAVAGLFLRFKQERGAAELERTLVRAFPEGELSLAFLEDGNNWISFEHGQRLIDALSEASGDPDFARRAGHLTASPEGMGFAYHILRAFGSPQLCYKKLMEMAPVYNRVGQFRLLELSSSRAVIAYRSSKVEPNLRFSEYRMGQFEWIPTMWGLPPARCWKRACQVTGGAAESIFELRWARPMTRLVMPLAGLGGGLASALLAWRVSWPLPWWAVALCGAALAGLTAGLLQRQRHVQSLRAELHEQSEALIKAWRDLQERFEEVQSLNSQLGSANERLKELDKLKSHFFANISHELRTPLTLTLGPVESLLAEVKDPGHLELLRMVRENQLRLTRLIDELLELAQLEAGKARLCFRLTDLRELVARLLSATRGAMELKGIRLEAALPEGSSALEVYADQEKLERVILNLLNNAFKFTPAGGTVKVCLERGAGEAILSVEDTGIGIPRDKLDAIFERFVRAEDSEVRSHRGTGIGLSLVKEYAELHHGAVSVESEVGRGSIFTLRLPLGKEHLRGEHVVEARDSSPLGERLERYQLEFHLEHKASPAGGEAVDSPSRKSRPTPSHPLLENARVLIVEDTADMRYYLRGLLSSEYEILTASDGLAGLERARAEQPDLVLSDVMMPKMSGRELCERIKSDPGPLGRTPVILITARAEEQTKLQSLAHGADDYLLKPFAAEELRLRVRNILLKHRQEEALRAAHQQLRSQKARIDGDLRAARSFQRSLLPGLALPPPLAGHVELHPAAPVGGDFYHVLSLGPGHSRILLADMVDHGVKAALRTIAAWAEYTVIDHRASTPAQVLRKLSEVAATKYQDLSGSFLCLDLRVAGRDRAEVRYAQAGGLLATRVTSRGWEDVPAADGFIIGLLPAAHYSDRELELCPGERLFLYTDGLWEQRDGGGRCFRDEARQRVWPSAGEPPSIEAACRKIVDEFHRFRGAEPQGDDVTLIGIELAATAAGKEHE